MKATQETIENYYILFDDQNKALYFARKHLSKNLNSVGMYTNKELKELIKIKNEEVI